MPGYRRGCALARALAQARANLGDTLADSLSTSKVMPWHEQGRTLARTRHTLERLRKRLNIYYKERCVLSRGRHGQRGKEDPRACFGHHAKGRPLDPWSDHPEPMGLDQAPASTRGAWAQPGTTDQSLSLREAWATSFEAWMDQVKAVLSVWVTTLVMTTDMTKARPRMSRIHGACAN
ncbi:hypothetical protein Syun_018743 [Stephania yunnanensis]|uniref:Uncharacterized protein n=1 Tax=Stephania yunnanensis TaxID=152371 RepID=A0AAP0IV59_9MAGN